MFLEAANQFSYSSEFKNVYPLLYGAAVKRGWLKGYEWSGGRRSEPIDVSFEECYNVAKKCTTISEFRETGIYYTKALKNKWLKHFDWLKYKKAVRYTYEEFMENAKQYHTVGEFKEKNPGLYSVGCRRDWIKDCYWLGRKKTREPVYTHELCFETAAKYEYMRDFRRENPGMYDAVLRNGWKKELDNVLQKRKPKYSFEEVKQVALKYETMVDFFNSKEDNKYYLFAKNHNWFDKFYWLKPADRKEAGYWQVYENNYNEAKKYDTLKDFREKNNSAYNAARENGYLKDYTWFDRKLQNYWNVYENNRKEALKYKTRTEFAKANQAAYEWARKNGWLDTYNWFIVCKCSNNYNSYKLSQLTENDIQKNPADNRFFCLKGIDIYLLILAGVYSKDYLKIAKTRRGTRTRINAVLSTIEEIQSRINNGEDYSEGEENNTVDVNEINEVNQLDETEVDDDDMVIDDETGLPVLPTRENILRNGDVKGLDLVEPTSENGRAIVENTIQTWFQTVSKNPEFVEDIRNYHGSKFYDYIKELFFEIYDAVTTMNNPAGYSLNYELYPYQKLLAYQLERRDSYSMWLDMGGGKTNCALYASRHNNLKNNVVIAPKSVLHESWVSQIYEAFPDSKIIAMFGISVDDFKSKKDTDSSRKYNAWLESHLTVLRNLKEFKGFGSGYTYLLINYDKFSQDYAKKLADTIACNHIDYVVLDEVQNVKVRNRKTTSERHVQVGYLMSQIRKCNPNIKTSALTGTPVLNDIMEAKSIVEITTGEEVSGVKNNRVTLPNVVEANKALLLNGFRYCPTIPINHTTRNIEIECSPETERQIRRLCYMGRNTFYSELESILTIAKINSPEVINELKPGTIVYLLFPYKNNTATEVVRKIESLGFKVGTYFGCTVDKHQAYSDFVEGRTDILVASSPVCEGVDGLQNRCDNMIILSLPQTYGKYDQLIKRIVRRRKEDSELKDKEVTIIIPQMYIELNENDESDEDEWSWDKSRWNAIRYKKSLADAVVDGELQKVFTIDWNKLYRNAMKVFHKGIKDEEPVVKSKIVVEVPEKEKKSRERATCVVMETHRLANSSNHNTTHQRFVDNPQEFDNYHDNRELSKADWVEDPVERIAAYINKRFKNKKIADLGCGTNKLSTLMKNGNTVTGFDHQQYKGNKDVVVADIGNLKGIVNDREYDVAVFCLSLWGKDYEDYFDEAHRILKDYRKMLIVEPVSNFGDGKRYGSPTEFIQTVEKHGFARLGGVEERNNFAYFRFEKE